MVISNESSGDERFEDLLDFDFQDIDFQQLDMLVSREPLPAPPEFMQQEAPSASEPTEQPLQEEYQTTMKTYKPYSPLQKLWYRATKKTCRVGLSHTQCIGMKQTSLKQRLLGAGFYKIRFLPRCDLSYRQRGSAGTIADITVAGKDDFRRDTPFPFNADIQVFIHQLRKAAIGFSPRDLKKSNVTDTVAYLTHQGFGAVKSVPIRDLKVGWLKLDGQVEKVMADGFENFRQDSQFPVDVEILVYYHTFKDAERS